MKAKGEGKWSESGGVVACYRLGPLLICGMITHRPASSLHLLALVSPLLLSCSLLPPSTDPLPPLYSLPKRCNAFFWIVASTEPCARKVKATFQRTRFDRAPQGSRGGRVGHSTFWSICTTSVTLRRGLEHNGWTVQSDCPFSHVM